MRASRGTRAVDDDERGNDRVDDLAVTHQPARRTVRAAERRRERGELPPDDAVRDTRTSLPRREDDDGGGEPASTSQQSRFESDAIARGTLLCTQGPEEGLTLKLIEGSYTVGRALENSFVLKDIAASRRHLRIEVDKRGVRAVDLGSGNGTRINGKKFVEQLLANGDRIEIGGSVLVFQESKARTPSTRSQQDGQDVHARVIMAADILAAELTGRARADDESADADAGVQTRTRGSPAGRRGRNRESERESDGRRARTDAEANKPSARNPRGAGGAGNRGEQLWKETFTNLPLDEIVPASEPLRGQRIQENPASTPVPSEVERPARGGRAQSRVALPRPAPLPVPPPRDVEVSSRFGRVGASSSLAFLASALGILVGGGLIIYAFFRSPEPTQTATTDTPVDVADEYARAITKAQEAVAAGDWIRSLEYSTAALQLRPGDPLASTYQREARTRLQAPPPAVPVPSTAVPPPDPPAQPEALGSNGAVAALPSAVAASTPPPKELAAPTPMEGTVPPEVRGLRGEPGLATTRPQPPLQRSVEPRAAEPRKAPATPPARRSTRGMSEDVAEEKRVAAVRLMRQDEKAACALLEEIISQTSSGSEARERADALHGRKCR